MREPSFYGRWYGSKVRPRWWSLVNWLKGYKFGPVQRHRCCDHTTPNHYAACGQQPSDTHVNAAESGSNKQAPQ